MPSNAKDNRWKIPSSKFLAAAILASSCLGHGQNNLSPIGSHYVILHPEEIPAADPLENQSETRRGNLFPVGRRSVLPPYRPHDQSIFNP